MAQSEDTVLINVKETGAKETAKSLDKVTASTDKLTEAEKEAIKERNKAAAATKKAREEAEKYVGTLGDMVKETEVFGISVNKLSSGFGNSIKAVKASVSSLKAFKVALIATGLGAFVVLLGTLVAAFASTKQGMSLVEDISSVLANTWQVVINRVSKLAKAITAFLDGKFSESFDLLKESVSGLGAEFAATAANALVLAQRTRDLAAEKNALLVSQAEEIANLEKLRNFSDDVTNSLEDRIAATEKARKIIAKQSADNVAIAEKELQLFKDSNDLQNLSLEQEAELAALQAEASIKRGEAIATDTGELTKLNGLRLELADRIAAEAEAVRLAEELKAQIRTEAEEAELAYIKSISDAKALAAQKVIDDAKAQALAEAAAAQEAADAKLAIEQKLFTDLSSLNNEFAQGVAIVQNAIALRDTIEATIKAFKDTQGGILVKLGAAAAAAAVGAALLSKLKAVAIPKAADGMLIGNSHAQGGMLIEAEGGEAIINKRSMAVPWIRQQASYLNEIGGGVPFFARGGLVPSSGTDPFISLERSFQNQRTVLVLDDLDTAQTNAAVTVTASTL
jgi:hypothetical protein